jgi:hypothetical protein
MRIDISPPAGGVEVSEAHRIELDRHFAWFEAKLPPRPARFVGWLRKPSSRYARIPLAILLNVSAEKACNESIKPLWRFHFCDSIRSCIAVAGVTQKAALLANPWLLFD